MLTGIHIVRLIVVLLVSWYLNGCKPTTNQRHTLRQADSEEPANAKFLQAFGGEEKAFAGAILHDGQGYAAFGVQQSIAGHPDKWLVIMFFSPPPAGHPVMQLQIHCRMEDGTPDMIDPVVFSSLSAIQTEEVLLYGVSASVAAALAQAADSAGWDTTKMKKTDCRFIHVDLDAHFEGPGK